MKKITKSYLQLDIFGNWVPVSYVIYREKCDKLYNSKFKRWCLKNASKTKQKEN